MKIIRVGVDLAKNVFQAHGVDRDEKPVWKRKLKRDEWIKILLEKIEPGCVIGMEACGGAHHWARQLQAHGYSVKLIAPQFVKPYVKSNKNDANDAEAICEAVTRPTMRFVEIKTCEQQGTLVLHRVRRMLMRQRVQLSNAIRGHMAEYGLVAPVGRNGLQRLIAILGNPDDERVPAVARASLAPLVCQFGLVNDPVLDNDRRVRASARSTELGCRLMEVPGVGPVLASAMVATVPDPTAFKSGRALAAWIGLVPRQNSSGGKEKLGGITKQGDRYLRQLLVAGALAVIRYAHKHGTKRPWLVHLLARRTPKIAAVALANKMARMIWAMMMTGERYREPTVAAA